MRRSEFRDRCIVANRKAEEASLPERWSSKLLPIVTLTKNSSNTLSDMLQSTSNNHTDRNYKIIAVDIHSTDETFIISGKNANKVLFKGPDWTAQVNFDIRNGQGRYVCRIRSDWILEPTVLEQSVKKFQDEGFGAILVHKSDDLESASSAR
jgi:glycosyltransferase involved in cell wall biosynthesis